MIKDAFGTDDLRNIDPNQIPQMLQKNSILPRLAFRKKFRSGPKIAMKKKTEGAH
jgi:hypothetical protein